MIDRLAGRSRALALAAVGSGVVVFALETAAYAQMSRNVLEGDDWLYGAVFAGTPVIAAALVGLVVRRRVVRGADVLRQLARAVWLADVALGLLAFVALALAVP